MMANLNTSKIFEGYRALGLVSGDKPFTINYAQKLEDLKIVVAVGRLFHSYSLNLRLIDTSYSHQSSINALCADSYNVFTCCDNLIYAWKRGHKWLTRIYTGHESQVHLLLSFGLHLLSVDTSNVLRVWDIKSGDTFMEMPFGDSFTISAMMHPSTYLNKILFGSKQGSLQLWNIRTQKLIYTFSGWNSGVMVIEQAPAVDVVAIGLENGFIIVHNLKFDKKIVQFFQEWGPVLALSFRTDGPPFLASASNQNHVAIWDLENRRLLTQMRDIHSSLVCGCQFILNEPLLVTNSSDNSIKVWCFDRSDDTARLLHSREGHFKPSNKIRFYQSDSLFIFSVSSDSTFRRFSVWSEKLNRNFGKTLKNRKAVKRRKLIEEVDLLPPAVDFSAESIREKDWDNIVCCHEDFATVTSWSSHRSCMGQHKLLHQRFKNDRETAALCVSLSSCGNYVVIGYSNGYLDRFNIQSGLYRATYGSDRAHDGPVRGIVVDELCKYVVSCGDDCKLKFWSFKSCTLLTTLNFHSCLLKMESHKESSLICLAIDDFTVEVVDIETRKVIRKLPSHQDKITDMAFSWDAKWLLVSSLDCSIRVWDLSSTKLIDWFKTSSSCMSLTISPNNEFLAIALKEQLGIYVYINLAIFRPLHLKALDENFVPQINMLPSISADVIDDSSNNIEAMIRESDDVSVLEDEDEPLINVIYKSPDQISEELITLSSFPTSRWKAILNFESLQQNSKPSEPVQKSQEAPFFLPTVSGLIPEFDLPKENHPDNSEKSRILKNYLGISEFGKLLITCWEEANFVDLFKKLMLMSPAEIDLELKSLDCILPREYQSTDLDIDQEAEVEEDKPLLILYFIKALEYSFQTHQNYELNHSYLSLLLKFHSKLIMKHQDIIKECQNLFKIIESSFTRLEDMFNESYYIINFIRGAQ